MDDEHQTVAPADGEPLAAQHELADERVREPLPVLFAAVALWGFGFGGVPTTVLSWGARTEPRRLEQIGGVIVTACNLAIALGAGIGGVLVDGVAATAPLLAGGAAAIAGAVVLTALPTRR